MNCSQNDDRLFNYIEGLMNEPDKQALENHVQTCVTCQQALKDMQTLQARLTEHGQNTIKDDLETHVLGAIVRGQKQQLKAITPHSPHLRRSIMKSPIIKFALAAIIVVACVLGFTLFDSTQNVALADVLTRIQQVQAYLYQMNMTVTTSGDLPAGYPATQDIKATILTAPEYGIKMTMDMDMNSDPNQNKKMIQEQYLQPQNNRMLMIMPDQKKYMEMELNDQILEKYKKQNNDPRMMIEQFIKCDYEEIDHAIINGIEVQGFHTTDPAYSGGIMGGNTDVTLWVDTKTQLPVQVDMDITMEGERTMHMKGVMTNFQWDVPVDASVFEPIIPNDYTTIGDGPIKMPEMNETTAINGLKLYRDYLGTYPKDLGMMTMMESLSKIMDANTPAAKALKASIEDIKDVNDPGEMGTSISNAMMDVMMPLQATMGFNALLIQQKKDPAYYGDIVTSDQPDLILMRWQIEEGQYRVIFSDLTAETVTPQQLATLENALPKDESQ